MSWIDDTIREFGHSIGIDGLALHSVPGGADSLVLDYGEADRALGFEREGEDLIVYLSQTVGHVSEIDMEKALSQGHFRSTMTVPLQAGLYGGNRLVFLSRIPGADVSQVMLENVLEALNKAQSEAMHRR